jgi:beta-glucosidase
MRLSNCRNRAVCALVLAASFVVAPLAVAQFPGMPQPKHYPWSDASLSPDVRADLVIKELTLDEKISLLHGQGMPFFVTTVTESNGGAGYSNAIPRLGIPAIQMADSAYGVTRGAAAGRYSTALPNNLAAASSWDPQAAFEYGALIGRELRAQGYSMSLGGGVNLPREPRNGRTFEYQGEDPLLAGTLDGNFVKGVQSEHIIGDLKHYALNDQESGRNAVNANIDKRSMRETDLRAFGIALAISDAGGVMCSYNRVNGDFACENSYLLTDVLKKAFQFKGFVLSDWGGTHSAAKASHAGLDMEQPDKYFYSDELKKSTESGDVSQDEINDHVHRILRTIFATGLFDNPVEKQVPDVEKGYATAQSIAEKSIVLLKNQHNVLPLAPGLHTLARRLGAGRCARRLRRSSSSAGKEPLRCPYASGMAAQLAAARSHRQAALGQGFLRLRGRSGCGRNRCQAGRCGHCLRLSVGVGRHGPAHSEPRRRAEQVD